MEATVEQADPLEAYIAPKPMRSRVFAMIASGAPFDSVLGDALTQFPDFKGDILAVVQREYARINTTLERRAAGKAKAAAHALWYVEALRVLQQRRRGPLVKELTDIEPADFYENYFEANRPFIIRGKFPEVVGKWSPRALAERFGDARVEFAKSYSVDGSNHLFKPQIHETATFRDFVAQIERGSESIYANGMNENWTSELSALLPEFPTLPGILGTARASTSQIWIGPAGTVTRLHYDTSNNLFIQLDGRKRFRIYPAYDGEFVYNAKGIWAEVDPEAPDDERHPLFRFASETVIELEPGDAMFVPVGWWHHVRSLTASVSVTLRGFRRPNVFAMHYD